MQLRKWCWQQLRQWEVSVVLWFSRDEISLCFFEIDESLQISNGSLKIYHPKRKVVFQLSFFMVFVKLAGGVWWFFWIPCGGAVKKLAWTEPVPLVRPFWTVFQERFWPSLVLHSSPTRFDFAAVITSQHTPLTCLPEKYGWTIRGYEQGYEGPCSLTAYKTLLDPYFLGAFVRVLVLNISYTPRCLFICTARVPKQSLDWERHGSWRNLLVVSMLVFGNSDREW